MALRRSRGTARTGAAAEATAADATTVALYGAGMIASVHAAAARAAGMRVVAVASRTPARAERLAAEFGARAVTTDDLRSGRVRADIVVVATPPASHADDAIALLGTGAAVLVEKPLCTTLDDADALVAASATASGPVLYGENLACSPVLLEVLRRAPESGRLRHLEVRALQSLPAWGSFTTDAWGGGALFDLGVHPLAVAMLCANACGAGAPASVSARLRGGTGHGTDEHAVVELRYDTGLVARVESSWQHGPTPQWDAQLAFDDAVLRAEFLPAPGLECDGEPVPILGPPGAPVSPLHHLGYVDQLLLLDASRRSGTPPAMDAAFGRRVLDVVLAAYRSAGRDGTAEPLAFTGPRNSTPLDQWRAGRTNG